MEAHLGGHGGGAGKWEIDGVLYNTLCNATEQEGLKKRPPFTRLLLIDCHDSHPGTWPWSPPT